MGGEGVPPRRQPWENWRTRARERQGEAPCSRPAAFTQDAKHKTQDTRYKILTQDTKWQSNCWTRLRETERERMRGKAILVNLEKLAYLKHKKDGTLLLEHNTWKSEVKTQRQKMIITMGGRRLHVPALLLYTSPIPTNVQLAIYVAAKKVFLLENIHQHSILEQAQKMW